jgi:NDP-sugar pyrophosphorylase family protein
MNRETRVVILAGGKGTRLAPYTTVLPKPLMPIHDMPILEIVLRQLKHHGFSDIVISIGHLAEILMAFFGDGAKWGLNIEYAIEDVPLGTIGLLRSIEGLNKPFIVMNGDVLTDIDYSALVGSHGSHGGLATIATAKREINIPFGLIEYDAKLTMTRFTEKPTLEHFVSMGIYVFDPKVMKYVPENRHYGFDNLMTDLLADGEPIHVFPFDGQWLDIGRPEDFESACELFGKHRLRFLPGF